MTKIDTTQESMPAVASPAQPTDDPMRQRRALPRFVQLGLLLVVFMAGGVVGAMIATNVIHSRMMYYREHAEALPADIVPRLQRRLALTHEQTDHVKQIIATRHPRMLEDRRQGAEAMLHEFQLMEEEIAEVLNPEQEQRWHTIARSVRQRFLPTAPSTNSVTRAIPGGANECASNAEQ